MQGLMMNTPLTITSIMRHAEFVHAGVEIVSVTHDNPRHRYSFEAAFKRVRQLANVFQSLGIKQGDRIGTLAWNDYRHFELYFATAGFGAVCNTINPRLFAEQVSYIINHAEDQWLFVDLDFINLLEQISSEIENVKGVVVLTSEECMPSSKLTNLHCYETLMGGVNDHFVWPQLEENTASALCYTSGTTGNPKGVLYSHRGTVLHAMMTGMVDTMAVSNDEVVMPVVPMFHVNAWGAPYVCAMVGAKLVLPGFQAGNGAEMTALINEEQVSLSMGVPTIWLALLDHLETTGEKVPSLRRTVVGGAACALSIQKDLEKHGVWVETAWGMTETGPLGSYNRLMPWMMDLSEGELDQRRTKAGRAIYGVDLKVEDDQGQPLPWDGESSGLLKVRGPWVASEYYGGDGAGAFDSDGWFDTGDVAAVDEYGYVQITDRAKDVIKSGGEWISSIDVENAVVAHPDVQEAAVIGIPHPKWTERPLLYVVKGKRKEVDKAEILSFLEGKIAKWWMPEDCLFIKEIPHTATGKIDKKVLRTMFAEANEN